MNGPASSGQEEPGQDPGESIHQEATATDHGQVYQAGRDLTVNKTVNTVNTMNIHLPPPVPPAGQIVEGDIPRRPPAFQPRPGLLDALKAQVRQEGAAVIDAVTGTPGVGKSILAASYAWACQQAGWPLIVWINAQHPDQILTGLAGLARRLKLHDPDDDARTAALKARDWLAAADQPGLLVFDNATAVDDVRPWCPATGEVQILITTRNRAFHTLFTAIDVGVFPPEQSVALLHQRTGDTTPGAEQVATELGHLPLALGQAGAYIHRRRLTYSAYLGLLRDYQLDRYLPHTAEGYPHGTAAAILLSVDQAEQTIPGAREMLELLAVLAESGVSRTILYGTTDPHLDPADTEDIDQVLADLVDTSLISFSDDGTTVLMHRLTSRVLRERAHHTALPGDGNGGSRLDQVLAGAVELLHRFNTHIPDGAATWAARPAVDMLAEQTAALHDAAATFGDPPHRLLALRAWCGQYLNQLADLARAIPLLQQTLADMERLLGGDHPDTLTSRNNLAGAYESAGDVSRAIPLYEQTLADYERLLDDDHPHISNSRNNLASAYYAAGDLARAIQLYEQTLADRERLLGGDHPDTLLSRNNLASAYYAAGDLGRAISMHEQTLADRERVLGGDQPDTLLSRNNLASAYYAAGDLGRAIPMHEQTLADRERVLGGDHPETLTSRNNLANAYASAGDLRRAIPLFEQTLADRERLLGGDHPATFTSRNNLAGAFRTAGDPGRAIPLYEQALSDCERVLGGDHPSTLTSRNNLAAAFRAAGDVGRAVRLYEQTLADCERVLGGDHPDTLISRNNLAYGYFAAGDLGRAIPLLEQTLADRERLLGGDQPDTLLSRNNLASAYQDAGELGPAIRLLEQTLADRERLLGGDHPDTLTSRNNLAGAYYAAGDLGRAIPLYEQTLAGCKRVLGGDHPTTRVIRDNLRTVRERGLPMDTTAGQRKRAGKPERNAPCDCGSGMKYKRCHGAPPAK
ncbi:tetratricopeptide repeat protein [Herbidospora sp. NBRC 101105]|uniref:tetratricopeptide repeat protein n=1 Tax=Herbidospora sp. NBRC 101105 TaxID=3032195 RepID=UPI0024A5BFC7|nr:tetratricopeptide repeat protein [Herbidospora sp. NBRC 101105]GLX92948.1 tetratricopeptide repeat protein [Herbidospora sp. NBRC 101105]